MTSKATQDWDLFELNEHNLDQEWMRQAKLYHHYALKLEEARADYDRAKAQRDVVVAELDKEVRLDPSQFGLPAKVTEKMVENTVLLQKRHRLATEEVIKARHGLGVLQAMVEALDHRKHALQNLVQLEARDYFAQPRAPVGSTGGRLSERREMESVFGSNRAKRPPEVE